MHKACLSVFSSVPRCLGSAVMMIGWAKVIKGPLIRAAFSFKHTRHFPRVQKI